jgi:hypothetical protein
MVVTVKLAAKLAREELSLTLLLRPMETLSHGNETNEKFD